ncbi:MAG: PHB depolymerase family esterase [Pseudomonadota bacterium]
MKLAGLLIMIAGPAAAGCGADAAPCQVPTGSYQIELPATGTDFPAVMFLHGWGGSGAGTMANRGMVEAALARGYAVIAPDGQPRAQGEGRTWDFFPDGSARRDETGFLKSVADDAAARFDIDRDRILLAGFSIGGSMTSYAACADPTAFAAFAPVAGSFWRPLPAACAGPVRLLHSHGWTDSTVPLEGRIIGGNRQQGDVFAAMDLWRATNGCLRQNPDSFGDTGRFWLRRWTGCAPGSALEFALHPGSHGVPEGWTTLALDWFEALPAQQP